MARTCNMLVGNIFYLKQQLFHVRAFNGNVEGLKNAKAGA
jgi:hypothetical protein